MRTFDNIKNHKPDSEIRICDNITKPPNFTPDDGVAPHKCLQELQK